jgi:hypothetical protein
MTPNSMLLAVFVLGFAMTLARDIPLAKLHAPAERKLLFTLHGLVLLLFVSFLFDLKLPMPTQIYLHSISKWVKTFMDTKLAHPI